MIKLKVIEEYLQCIKNLVNNENKKAYQSKPYGEEHTVVILGEKHGDSIEECCQEKLIKDLVPKYLLVENITNDVFRIWGEKYGCKVVLCDLESHEKENKRRKLGFKNFGFNESVSAEYESLKPQLNDAREIKMGEIIMDNYSRESSKPLLAIIGHKHAMEKSKIHSTLKEKVGYITIWQDQE
jgi:hypothetical protein